ENKVEHYKIMNPLVLLTGAAKCKNKEYLPGVKTDLMILQKLFAEDHRYRVHCTYDPDKPETEMLTLSRLNNFLKMHFSNVTKKQSDYDSLIFVWCGHGRTTHGEDILITSGDLFTCKTNVFLNKPKIFIKNTYQKDTQSQQFNNKEADTLIIFPTASDKEMTSDKGSYFIRSFYS
ncbi:hypothetical protein RFI_40062, partial [Reticulomyxa filosa]